MDNTERLFFGALGVALVLGACTDIGTKVISDLLKPYTVRQCSHGLVGSKPDKSVYCVSCGKILPKLSKGKDLTKR